MTRDPGYQLHRNIGPVEKISSAVKTVVNDAVRNLHTCIPGHILSYNSETQRATVQVAIKRQDFDGNTYQVPEITEAPVQFPRGGGYSIVFPLSEGDDCLILFSERALDNWKTNGGIQEPSKVIRFHDYTDAIVIPGVYPSTTSQSIDAGDETGLVVQSDDVKILIGSDGKIRLGKRGSTPSEAAVLGDVLATGLQSILNSISTGPIGVDTSTGATIATHPTLQTAISNWITTYISTASSNIKSQLTFVDRGP